MTITDLCTICQHSLEDPKSNYSLDCGHTGHKDCFQRMINRIFANQGKDEADCPLCRKKFTLIPSILTLKSMVAEGEQLPLDEYNRETGLNVTKGDLQPELTLNGFISRCLLEASTEITESAESIEEKFRMKFPELSREFDQQGSQFLNDRGQILQITKAVFAVIGIE